MRESKCNSIKSVRVFIFLFFSVNVFVVDAQKYQIPNASTQPLWVFPMYFEEGTGNKDTLYLGYDPTANQLSFQLQDTIFGVKNLPIDPNTFRVSWRETECDSTLCSYKVNVTSMMFNFFPSQFLIECHKGILPLKISWDTKLFYSDSLPFPHHNTSPLAQGFFYFGFHNSLCRENYQLVGDVDGEFLICDENCMARDSVVIFNVFNAPDSVDWGALSLYIQEWTNGWVGIDERNSFVLEKIFIDADNKLNILNKSSELFVQIFDLLGTEIISKNLKPNEFFEYRLPKTGIYFIAISENKKYKLYKLLNYEK